MCCFVLFRFVVVFFWLCVFCFHFFGILGVCLFFLFLQFFCVFLGGGGILPFTHSPVLYCGLGVRWQLLQKFSSIKTLVRLFKFINLSGTLWHCRSRGKGKTWKNSNIMYRGRIDCSLTKYFCELSDLVTDWLTYCLNDWLNDWLADQLIEQ